MGFRSWFRHRPTEPPAPPPPPPPPEPLPLPPLEACRPLVDLLADPLPEPWRSSRWAAFSAEFEIWAEDEGDSPVARRQALIEALQHPGEPDWWLALAVDWKDGREAVLQADALARAHGVTETYEWAGDEPPRVPDVLDDFERWALRHGLRYVRWYWDADAYYGFLLRPEQVPEWERLTAELRLHD